MNTAINDYIQTNSKSQTIGFFLTLLFGPVGLFYSNWIAALILCIVAISSATTVIGPVICWIIAMIMSAAAVSNHNDKVASEANLRQ